MKQEFTSLMGVTKEYLISEFMKSKKEKKDIKDSSAAAVAGYYLLSNPKNAIVALLIDASLSIVSKVVMRDAERLLARIVGDSNDSKEDKRAICINSYASFSFEDNSGKVDIDNMPVTAIVGFYLIEYPENPLEKFYEDYRFNEIQHEEFQSVELLMKCILESEDK